jgi:hypothetical protein
MPKKIKTDLTFKQIGEAIKNAWIAGAGTKQIDRDALIAALDLQPGSGNADQKNVVYDFITDQEIDDDTRMVWICVPSPDTKGSWVTYANTFVSDQDLEDLGKAALFGCGR